MAIGLEGIRMAASSLWTHKLRSTMTILGVVIGVASVLAITSLSAAFEDSITSQFDALDDRSIFVQVGQQGQQDGPPDGGQATFVFTEVDRDRIEAMAGVDRVLASGAVPVNSVQYDGETKTLEAVVATYADGDEVRDPGAYRDGGPFTDGASEVVLGHTMAKYLSGAGIGEDPTIQAGDVVTIRFPGGEERTATVAGILAEQGTLFGAANDAIYVPVDPFYQRTIESPTTGETAPVFASLTVIAAADADINEVRDDVKAYLETESDAARFLADVEGVDFFVGTASDIQSEISSAFDQITVFIAGIAGISLLVGGIMIGTIMLITVSERTKEIGMMKAIGALDRQVLWAFLVEAIMVGFIGSIVGILLGLGAGALLVETLFASDDMAAQFIVPWDWVGIAVLVGVGTGVVAGFFPARRATQIEPVEALSYE